MITSTVWLTRLETLCSKYETSIQSEVTATDDLARIVNTPDSPVEAITLEFQRNDPYKNIKLGTEGDGSPTDIETAELGQYVCRVCIWRNNRVRVDGGELRKLLVRLAQGHWKPKLHDRFRLLSFHYPETVTLLENTIVNARGEIYLLFTDLDHFKQEVNDKYGQDAGDQAILQFGAFFDAAVRPFATPIHRSGDEYCAIVFSARAEEALMVAERVHQAAQNQEFLIKEHLKEHRLKLGTTTGLTAAPQRPLDYATVEDLAVMAVKPPTGKRRGKIRFSEISGSVAEAAFDERAFRLAQCMVKSSITSETPFSSAVLNIISRKVKEQSVEHSGILRIQSIVDDAIKSTTLEVVPGLLQASLSRQQGSDVSMQAGPVDIALSVAHGIYRAKLQRPELLADTRSVSILIDPGGNTCTVSLNPSKSPIMKIGSEAKELHPFDLGGFVTADGKIDERAGRRALLIKIGHGELSLPRSLFAEVLVVDDRPTRGGGLPDFWEATIARLVGALDRDRNITATYVLGDPKFASFTSDRLHNVAEWNRDAEWLAFKTGMPANKIRNAASRLSGSVTFSATPDDVVRHLINVLEPAAELTQPAAPVTDSVSPFLERTLSEREIRLGLADGCRVATAARAYPVVIEIIRKTKQAWEARDQAGVSLRELTDFKVHLTTPCVDKIPAFYKDELKSLEAYFQREFIDSSGTFGKVLHQTSQLEPILTHISGTIGKSQLAATTRRAILIIPHDDRLAEEVSPLGLVCVRIVPRITDARLRFDFSFVWRTVEVLVGFPYSLYGSVRFSEHLTEQIRTRLDGRESLVEMGELSYIAQSLHMFTDEYGQIIARRIVNDASV